jgi:hypothetical protein
LVGTAANISGCDVKALPNGSIVATYWSSEADGIVYAVLSDGKWSKQTVYKGDQFGKTSLAFDIDGSPCICFGQGRYITSAPLPTFVLFAYVESYQVELYWSYPEEIRYDAIGSFVLSKGMTPSNVSAIATVNGTQTNFRDVDVVDHTDYYYQVTAFGKGGEPLSKSTNAHIWFQPDYNSTVAIMLRTRLHGGVSAPSLSLEGAAMALRSEAVVKGIEIEFRASNDLGVSWDDVGSTMTSENGDFNLTWVAPEPGNYLIEASWQNSTSAEHGVRIISIGIASSPDRHSVTVESNSTIYQFNYNDSEGNASFKVSGADGSSGYTRLCISKELAGNDSDINITIDGVRTNCTIISDGDFWVVYFEYHHSEHTIQASFISGQSSPDSGGGTDNIIVLVIVLAGLTIGLLAYSYLRGKRRQ